MVSTTSSPNKRAKRPSYSNKPAGHIPRPLNSFMCFRAECCRQKPPGIKIEHRKGETLSVTLSRAWKSLSEEQKQRWVDMAAEKKREHKKLYPDYKYRPVPKNPEKEKETKAARRRARAEAQRRKHSSEAMSDQVEPYPAPQGNVSPSASAPAAPASALETSSPEADVSSGIALLASTSRQDPYATRPGNTLELFNVDQPYPQLPVSVHQPPLSMLPSPYSMSEHSSPTESLPPPQLPLHHAAYSPLALPSSLYYETNLDKVLVFRSLLCDRCAAIHALSFPADAPPNHCCHVRKISLCERCVSVNRREELKVMQYLNARHVYHTEIQPDTLPYQATPSDLMNMTPGPSPTGSMLGQASQYSLDSLEADQAAEIPVSLDQFLNLDDQFNGSFEW